MRNILKKCALGIAALSVAGAFSLTGFAADSVEAASGVLVACSKDVNFRQPQNWRVGVFSFAASSETKVTVLLANEPGVAAIPGEIATNADGLRVVTWKNGSLQLAKALDGKIAAILKMEGTADEALICREVVDINRVEIKE